MKYYANELYHFGILGQKWGERRYQNNDGTYTEEGKARRRKSDSYSDDYKRYKELSTRDPKTMSNKELQEYNNRATLETNYARLQIDNSTIKKGIAYVAAAAAVISTVNNLGDAISRGKSIYNKFFGKKE